MADDSGREGGGLGNARSGRRRAAALLWSLKVPLGLAGAWFAFVILMRVFYVTPIPEITGPAIGYDHLSSEASEPFPIAKKRKDNVLYYRFFRWKWPDARACLTAAEAAKAEPDLRRINWAKMRWGGDIEVCMWRIFASYGTPEKAKAWFDAQGLEAALVSYQASGSPHLLVQGLNPKRYAQFYVPNSGVFSMFGKIIKAEWFSVRYDLSNTIIAIGYGHDAW